MLLDAAAFVPTNRLDLSVVQPEFVAVSWYKVFGYPTGVGCLLARRDALARLRRPWFSGGTIWGVSVQGGWHRMLDDEGAFEDGTLNFLSIPDVTAGLDWIERHRHRPDPPAGRHAHRLAARQPRRLRHSNGAPMVRLYGPAGLDAAAAGPSRSTSSTRPGASSTSARSRGTRRAAGISLRTGCFCNPGRGGVGVRPDRKDVRGPCVAAARWPAGFLRADMTTVDDYLAHDRPADRRRRPGIARHAVQRSRTWRRSSTSPSAPTATAWPTWPA